MVGLLLAFFANKAKDKEGSSSTIAFNFTITSLTLFHFCKKNIPLQRNE
jgi:hypothetical protein